MAGKKPFWSKAGEPPTFPNPQVPGFSVGGGQGEASALAGNNNDRVSHVSPSEPRRTAFHRGAVEQDGARLSISPSAKIPQNEPASGMNQANTKIVSSRTKGRSTGNFTAGMVDL